MKVAEEDFFSKRKWSWIQRKRNRWLTNNSAIPFHERKTVRPQSTLKRHAWTKKNPIELFQSNSIGTVFLSSCVFSTIDFKFWRCIRTIIVCPLFSEFISTLSLIGCPFKNKLRVCFMHHVRDVDNVVLCTYRIPFILFMRFSNPSTPNCARHSTLYNLSNCHWMSL